MSSKYAQQKSNVYSYVLGSKLYLNITNACTNRCEFCVRESAAGVTEGSLWLEHQPTVQEVLDSIEHPEKYEELVFCGFGEPLSRVDAVVGIARELRKYGVPVRINTNGQANLIHGRNIVPDLAGLIDIVSISLNAESAEKYQAICHSVYGEKSFQAVLDFTAACKAYIPKVILSVVDRPGIDLDACRKIAESLGVDFRVRQWNPSLA